MTGTIEINGRTAKYAQSWNELPAVQLMRLAPIVLGEEMKAWRGAVELAEKGKGKNPQRRAAAMQAYMQVACQVLPLVLDGDAGFRFKRELVKLGPEHYAMIIGTPKEEGNPVQWTFTGGPVVQHIPIIKVRGEAWHGPKDFLGAVTFIEYLTAEERYKQWQDGGGREALQKFVAQLFRPVRKDVKRDSKEWKGDVREPHVASVCDGRAALLADADEGQLLAVALYWRGCNERLRVRFPHVFNRQGKGKSNPQRVILRLAGSVKNEDVEGVSYAPVRNVMEQLEMMNEDAIERKAARR
jgi:hypothetical protein